MNVSEDANWNDQISKLQPHTVRFEKEPDADRETSSEADHLDIIITVRLLDNHVTIVITVRLLQTRIDGKMPANVTGTQRPEMQENDIRIKGSGFAPDDCLANWCPV